MKSIIKDIKLAKAGRQNIDWAEKDMPVVMAIRKRFQIEKPFKGIRIAACLHVTKETAVLAETLSAGAADVALCASNPLSTQDDVAAALADKGLKVYAIRGIDNKGYYECLTAALELKPHITIDDGADLVNLIHTKKTELIKNVLGGQEETTTGVIRLKAMAKDGELKYPMIAINNAKTKSWFDNFYGTGQSTLDGIIRATDVLLAGKNFVVAGFGNCGSGLALKARGMGCNVIVTEVDPVKALQAKMLGYSVMAMDEAAKVGDVFVTVTGNKHVLRKEHFLLMKDKAIVCNTGHFNVEINLNDLSGVSSGKRLVRPDVEEYALKSNGNRIFLLAQGRLVNLACAKGHPSEVMDMSFSNQALCSEFIVKNKGRLKKIVYDVPKEIDEQVALLKLQAMDTNIDKLTAEQVKYLASWREGT